MFRNPTKAEREHFARQCRMLENPWIDVRVGTGNTKELHLNLSAVNTTPLCLQKDILGSKRRMDKKTVLLPMYDADAFAVYSHWLHWGNLNVSCDKVTNDVLKQRELELDRLYEAKQLAKTLGDEAYLKVVEQARNEKISLLYTLYVYGKAAKQAFDTGVAYVKKSIDHLNDGLSRLGRIAQVLLQGSTAAAKWLNKTIPM